MSKLIKCIMALLICASLNSLTAQVTYPKFGSGIQVEAKDTSFYLKLGGRFQTLMQHDWDIPADGGLSNLEDHSSRLFIRRSRLKFSGWAVNPRLKYKMELALSNRDNGGGNSSRFNNAANIILDASIDWNFKNNMSLWFGQGKLPGNRERVVSSGNLQFVDRSRLNSRFNLDRDVAIMLKNYETFGEQFILRQTIAISSGEGKNVTSANEGGYGYTLQLEALPFGKFQSKGDYVGSAVKRESSPKLAISVAFDLNKNAGRERGQLGDFLVGSAEAKDIRSFFADLMYKYKGVSVMAEYAYRTTEDGDARYFTEEGLALGTYYMGQALNLQLGYMFENNVELAGRYTTVNPEEFVANNEVQYTLGLNKFFVGHKLKVQTDITLRAIDESDNELISRLQFDFHF